MIRIRSAVEISALSAPAMSLAIAIERFPADKLAFNKVRYRWVEVVRGHPVLTAAQRQVGIVIAQEHINHNPKNPWFRSAWAAHQTIADKTGLTRRTVVSAMLALKQIGLIAIEQGGGWKVRGGRTDRYTLRIDRLDQLENAARIVRRKDVQKLRGSNLNASDDLNESGEKGSESREIDGLMMRNSQQEDVNDLRTTLSNSIPLGGLPNTFIEPQPLATSPVKTQRLGNERKEEAGYATAQDQRDLAVLLGEGNLEEGYCRLYHLDQGDVNDLALRYRLNRSSGDAVRAEAIQLMSNQGNSECNPA